MKIIGIIGCGWLGTKLAERLSSEYRIYVTSRKQENHEELISLGYHSTVVNFSDSETNIIDCWEWVSSIDIAVIMAPFSTRATPLSNENKMNNLIRFIGDFKGQVFFMSSTGVYPKDKLVFHENDLPTQENAIEKHIKAYYPQVNILRLGGLMGDNRLLSNYKVSNLEEPANHIHFYDICSVICKMIQIKSEGKLYNIVAPMHPSKKTVIESQLNGTFNDSPDPEGRIISSDKLIKELEFEFKYPDPRSFH